MTTVTPKPGYYLVRLIGPQGIRTHLVGKDKHCSCGGNARRQCSHIRAVAEYLQSGGEPAPDGTAEVVRDSKPATTVPEACPICGSGIKRLGPDFWRCADDASHYWRWRSEQNGGAIRKFLTQPHPVKSGPFYAMSEQEREAFLLQAAQRMHRRGYTPGGNHNGQ
jgi:hypothetical protein